MKRETFLIKVQGIVQGVGFRPFIKRLASHYNILGTVHNSLEGVEIKANLSKEELDAFIKSIKTQSPPLSHITNIEYSKATYIKFDSFEIIASKKGQEGSITLISPDAATCNECRNEILNNKERRHLYPFTNCTNCGPRYSIIKSLPYDRRNTTMASFPMCKECESEYLSVEDRRFHAEPIACSKCGPSLSYHNIADNSQIEGNNALKAIANLINSGEIVAIKGLGGYHLICSATDEAAVSKLRLLKQRKTKPFAVMVENISTLKEFSPIPPSLEALLTSHIAPIVISNSYNLPLPNSISPLSNNLGIMLAYTPLHILLFQYLNTKFIIATSGNAKDEPIAKTEMEAEKALSQFTNHFLHHNREIYSRIDDSVISYHNNSWALIRRARGFAPYPIKVNSQCNEAIFAAGAHLKSTEAFYKSGYIFLSQYIGDLDNIATTNMYEEVFNNLSSLLNVNPTIALRDLHNEYYSSKFVQNSSFKIVEKVQHHVAHFASCLAENSFDKNAIGIVLDGFGLGYINNKHVAMGGEVFIKIGNTIKSRFHLKRYLEPGMDASQKKPIRMLISYLYTEGLLDEILPYIIENKLIEEKEVAIIKLSIDKGINSIESSSCGRLFEAVGSILLKNAFNEYEGELAILLENLASKGSLNSQYTFNIEGNEILIKSFLTELIKDIKNNVEKSEMALKFHRGIANILKDAALKIREEENIKAICLSGGCMQNNLLLEMLKTLLEDAGFIVLTHSKVPANDMGIAVGQIYYYLNELKYIAI